VSIIASLKPEMIVFTGDGVNSDEGIPLFKKTMKSLSKIAPLFGVRGNWEAWWFTHIDTFKGTGLIELNGTARPVRVAGQTIWIGGVAVDEEQKLDSMLTQMPKDAFRIILHHFPAASTLVDGRADLLLSGDTHDGQLKLPVIGPLIRIRRWGTPFYESGIHHTAAGLDFYVNRGIGMEGHHVPRVRFNCPPEIALIELSPKI
jgi:predicted MPP superfamily phosphohydrolase